MSRMPSLLVVAISLCAAPLAGACEASIASMVLKGQHAQAAALFVLPEGTSETKDVARIAAQLRGITAATQAFGNPEPLTTQKTSGRSFRLSAGYNLPSLRPNAYTVTKYAAQSPTIPGLIMSVLSVPGTSDCRVFTVQMETFDPEGIKRLLNAAK